MLFDSHVHLNDDKLYPIHDEVIRRAIDAGVGFFVCIGYDVPSSLRAMELADKYPHVFAAIGFHPENADLVEESDFTWLETNLNHEKVVAVGEIGLDYYWDKTFVEKQKAVFRRQIEIASRHDLPIVVHMRDASGDTLDLLRKHKPHALGGVMHCYSGSVESMRDFLDLGMKISLAGPVTFKNAKTPKAVAEAIPIDDLLIETDAPYLAPHPYRGKMNEPAYLPETAKAIAAIRGMDFETLSRKTTMNAMKLFRINQ